MTIRYEQWSGADDFAMSPSILSKAFDVLGAFDQSSRVMTLTEITRKTGLPKSTVHRLVNRLLDIGVLESWEAGYQVGIRMLHTVSTMPVNSMREIAVPHLSRLQAAVKGAVHLGVLRGASVVIVQAVITVGIDHPVGASGAKLPAHLTSLGRVMMAHLDQDAQDAILNRPLVAMTPRSTVDPAAIRAMFPEIRRTKLALSNDEVDLGLRTVAAPILIKGHPMGAVSIQVNPGGTPVEKEINALRVVTKRITEETYDLLIKDPSLFPFGF